MAGEEQESKENMEESSPELVIKHPLQHKWSLWFYKNDKNKAWEENLLEITSFDTVEDFWALYNHIEVASKMPIGCDYSLFKYGIKPMWEDDRNKQGGRWLINIGKHLRNSDLDNYWLETLLCLIGEAFDECSDDVCGAVVQVRAKSDKIGVWTADVKNTEYNIKIGKKLKERLNIHRGVLGYEDCEDITWNEVTKSTRISKNFQDLYAWEYVPAYIAVTLLAHADTQTKTGSVAKCRYQV